eukprot:g6902.t1
MARWRQLLCGLAVLIGVSQAQTDAVTPWLDVCTSEDFLNYRAQLCPATFVVSTLAFNPLYPLAISNVTIILQPSEDLQSSIQTTQFIELNLPGFEAIGTTNVANANLRDLPITAGNTVPLGVDPLFGYNTYANPLFTDFAQYNIRTRLLRLMVRTGNSLLSNRDTEITVCCMKLPAASPKDFTGYTISGPTSLDTIVTIPEENTRWIEPILSTPFIDPGLQWEFLRVSFEPPISQHVTIIHLTLRPANALTDRARIILSMPEITRVNNVSGEVSFNTANSISGADWMFFESSALWDAGVGTLTFFLRQGKVLLASRQVTLSTNPGEFELPVELAADSPTLTVSARSFDNIDEVVRETPVTQSSAVPHVRNFTFTRLAYTNNVANQQTNVLFHFMTNRPLFAGSVIYLRLSGFTAQRVEVPLKGTTKVHFRDESGYFNLPENILELHITRTIYSDESLFELEMVELILPPALYANDTSLLAWNSDPGAPQQPVDDSPMVGNGYKTFKRSQLAFEPSEPRLAANITFTLEPSIVFYQGDMIVIHMYGFACWAEPGQNSETSLAIWQHRPVDDVGSTEEEAKWQRKHRALCALNLAACKQKLDKFDEAIAACDTALELDPDNVKALYRRAESRIRPVKATAYEHDLAIKEHNTRCRPGTMRHCCRTSNHAPFLSIILAGLSPKPAAAWAPFRKTGFVLSKWVGAQRERSGHMLVTRKTGGVWNAGSLGW